MRCFRDHACGGHQVCTYPSCLVAEDGSNSYRYHATGSPAGGDAAPADGDAYELLSEKTRSICAGAIVDIAMFVGSAVFAGMFIAGGEIWALGLALYLGNGWALDVGNRPGKERW